MTTLSATYKIILEVTFSVHKNDKKKISVPNLEPMIVQLVTKGDLLLVIDTDMSTLAKRKFKRIFAT